MSKGNLVSSDYSEIYAIPTTGGVCPGLNSDTASMVGGSSLLVCLGGRCPLDGQGRGIISLRMALLRPAMWEDRNSMVGAQAIAENRVAPSGYVRVHGELWQGEERGGEEIPRLTGDKPSEFKKPAVSHCSCGSTMTRLAIRPRRVKIQYFIDLEASSGLSPSSE